MIFSRCHRQRYEIDRQHHIVTDIRHKRSDYNLQIPSVPFVANVSDDVVLTIDFVAQAVTQ